MDSTDIQTRVKEVFASNAAPEKYTDRNHCEECAEHDETLRTFTPETIGIDQLGNPGWDPICFVLPDAFKYYFPALVRLALEAEGLNSYLEQFLFHVTYQGENSRYFKYFSKAEREAALDVLRYIRSSMKRPVKEWGLESELDEAIELWSRLTKNA